MEDGTEFLRYVDFPEKFVYVQKEKKWKPRVNRSDTIGRIHSVSPASGDVFYLRMLLHDDHCRGKVSFTDLPYIGPDKARQRRKLIWPVLEDRSQLNS